MVTHDVALKSYGNKVLRLVDGKMQKTEFIEDSIREKAI